MKYKWKVAEKPTGMYRSFQPRGWPSAYYENEMIAAHILCDDDYYPSDVRTGKHGPLTVRFADHSRHPWVWMKITRTFKTLDEAKEGFKELLQRHPEYAPKKVD